jgi:hypothetical protein
MASDAYVKKYLISAPLPKLKSFNALSVNLLNCKNIEVREEVLPLRLYAKTPYAFGILKHHSNSNTRVNCSFAQLLLQT